MADKPLENNVFRAEMRATRDMLSNRLAEQEEYYRCEQVRQEQSWKSAKLIAALGLLQTVAYAAEYSNVVNWRNEINRKLYNCAKKEHDHWSTVTHPHINRTYDYIHALPEITPKYLDPLSEGLSTEAQVSITQSVMESWVADNDSGCNTCMPVCDTELSSASALARANSAHQITHHNEVRARNRREIKAMGQNVVNRSLRNVATPGRQAMELSLNMTNSLVAMASSGLNSGMATLGRGVQGMAMGTSMGGS